MDIRACYDAMGADYEEVFGRFHSEKLIIKFAGKFLDDPSYASLCSTLAAKDYPEAFRAAHTLKGVSQNLGFTPLYQASHEITEALRADSYEETEALLPAVTEAYDRTVRAIQQLDA